MTSVLEHRADVIRKLKETLRKIQQDDEQSCNSHYLDDVWLRVSLHHLGVFNAHLVLITHRLIGLNVFYSHRR